MTTKTSLFNKGIYKSTLKRYAWGGALYFIILFMFTGLSILLSYSDADTGYRWRYGDYSLILDDQYIIVPLLLTIVVPTVAGLMIFRFIHSKKASVFIHSLPVKREANYVSSVMAGLTLMAAPVILNTLILMIISACGYSQLFSVADCGVWMLWNLFGLFIMFSAVCFVASITGNSFAMVVLNALFHSFALISAAGLTIVANIFLYGFANDDTLINKVFNHTFPTKLISEATTWGYSTEHELFFVIEFIVIAVVLYALSAILYKKRNLETAEDVAGFKCLNPIFKYLATALGALTAFSIAAASMQNNQAVFWLIVIIISAVIYFACEMILKKTLRVWKSYKGYAVFAAVFAAVMCVFAFTSFFGFETRVPKADKVTKIAVYDYYSDEEPFLEDMEVIARAMGIHNEMLVERPVVNTQDSARYFHIKYELENGSAVHRRYGVSEDKFHEIMNNLYSNGEYKKIRENIFNEMKSLVNVYIREGGIIIEDDEQKQALLDSVRKDVNELDFNQLYNNSWGVTIEFEYVPEKTALFGEVNSRGIYYAHQTINANFKNTIAWLSENGYWDSIKIRNTGTIYIAENWDALPFVKDGVVQREFDPEKEKNVIKLEGEAAAEMIEYIHTVGQSYISEEKSIRVYQLTDLNAGSCRMLTQIPRAQAERLFE